MHPRSLVAPGLSSQSNMHRTPILNAYLFMMFGLQGSKFFPSSVLKPSEGSQDRQKTGMKHRKVPGVQGSNLAYFHDVSIRMMEKSGTKMLPLLLFSHRPVRSRDHLCFWFPARPLGLWWVLLVRWFLGMSTVKVHEWCLVCYGWLALCLRNNFHLTYLFSFSV